MSIFTWHAYVPDTTLRDKGTAFTAVVVKQSMEQAGIIIDRATIINAQTIEMIGRTHQKRKTIVIINIRADQSQWD